MEFIHSSKHGLECVTLGDGGVAAVRGQKTIYNRKMLETIAAYDKTKKAWIFKDLTSAKAAWKTMVELCEVKQSEKRAKVSEWKTKKRKQSAMTEEEEEAEENEEREGEHVDEDDPILVTKRSICDKEEEEEDHQETPVEKIVSVPLKKPTAKSRKIKIFEDEEEEEKKGVCISTTKDGFVSVQPPRKKDRRSITGKKNNKGGEGEEEEVATILSYSIFELSYAVGKTIPVCIRYRIGWKTPQLNDLFWPSECESVIVPCEVIDYSNMEGRLYLKLRPRRRIEWTALTGEDGMWPHSTDPNDTFLFRSQPLIAVKERDMRKCTFEPIFNSMHHKLLADPEHAFHISIQLTSTTTTTTTTTNSIIKNNK